MAFPLARVVFENHPVGGVGGVTTIRIEMPFQNVVPGHSLVDVHVHKDLQAAQQNEWSYIVYCPPDMINQSWMMDETSLNEMAALNMNYSDLTRGGLWMWTDNTYALFISRTRDGRWLLPTFMVSCELLNKQPVASPLIATMLQTDANNPQVTSLTRKMFLFSSARTVDRQGNNAPDFTWDVEDAQGNPIQVEMLGTVSLVFANDHVLWTIQTTSFIDASKVASVLQVAVEHIPRDRMTIVNDLQKAAPPPGFFPLPHLPDRDFHNELYMRMELAHPGHPEIAESLVPPKDRYIPFYNEYRRRLYYFRILRPQRHNTSQNCGGPHRQLVPTSTCWVVEVLCIASPPLICRSLSTIDGRYQSREPQRPLMSTNCPSPAPVLGAVDNPRLLRPNMPMMLSPHMLSSQNGWSSQWP